MKLDGRMTCVPHSVAFSLAAAVGLVSEAEGSGAAEGAGEEKAHEMAWGDESERVGHAHPPDVPAGYFGSMRESLTKSDLKNLIRLLNL